MSLSVVAITLNIKNNRDYPVRINVLGSPVNPLDTVNSTTEYRWDVTAYTPTVSDTLVLEYMVSGSAVFSTFTYQLSNANTEALIIALDSLGIGYFQSYIEAGQLYLSTYNNNVIFGNLTITANGVTTTSTTTSTTTAAPTTSTTSTTTTVAPTSTTTTTSTSTTTAAPTSTTSTTSTTTAAPTSTTSTTSTTTTAAPTTTTSTTTTTTTVNYVIFTLAQSFISGAQACSDYPTVNTTLYYAALGSTLTNGTIIYLDSALTIPAPDAFYSNGVDYWNTGASSGNLQNQTSCGFTSTTTSTTTTTTTEPPITTSTTTTTTTNSVFSCSTTDTGFSTSAIFDLGTTTGNVTITGSGLTSGDTFDIIYPVGGSIIHTTTPVDGSGNLLDNFYWVYDSTNTTAEITLVLP